MEKKKKNNKIKRGGKVIDDNERKMALGLHKGHSVKDLNLI